MQVSSLKLFNRFTANPFDFTSRTSEDYCHVIQWQAWDAICPDVRGESIDKLGKLATESGVIDLCQVVQKRFQVVDSVGGVRRCVHENAD